jgi:hypothetical protein
MRSQAVRLPDRFPVGPVGTRYVIEGREGRIHLRYLEFPDGRHVVLPSQDGPRSAPRQPRKRQRSAGRK